MKTHEQRRKEKLLLKINREDGNILRFASKELRDNKEIVLAAVKRNGISLYYASDRLKNDKEIVLTAVKDNGYSLRYANRALRDNREIALAAINDSCMSAQYVNRRWFDDEDFIMSIHHPYYRGIIFNELGSHRLKSNKRFMLKLISSLDGIADNTISTELTNDKDIVEASLNSDIYSFRFFYKYLYRDESLLLHSLYNYINYNYLSTGTLKNAVDSLICIFNACDISILRSKMFILFLHKLVYAYHIDDIDKTKFTILKNKIIEDLPIIKSWSEDMLLTHYENIYYGRNEEIQPVALPDFE